MSIVQPKFASPLNVIFSVHHHLDSDVVAAWLSSTLLLFSGGNCLESGAVVPVKFWEGVSKLQALVW